MVKKKLTMLASLVLERSNVVRHFLVQYGAEIMDAGMRMSALILDANDQL
jgi:hypothetical protein